MQTTPDILIEKEKEICRKVADIPENVEIEFLNIGWTSRVYSINNGEIIFKFPRQDSVKEEYALEIQAYTIAREIGSVRTPIVLWRHPTMNYVGYKGGWLALSLMGWLKVSLFWRKNQSARCSVYFSKNFTSAPL